MSINRIRPMLPAGPQDETGERAQQVLRSVLNGGGSALVDEYQRQHPGEQCFLLVLDGREEIVQQLVEVALPHLRDGLAHAIAATPATTQALMVQVVPRAAGIEVARFLAKDETQMQAMCDQFSGRDALAIFLACGRMLFGDVSSRHAAADPGAAERARRQDRSRRHGR